MPPSPSAEIVGDVGHDDRGLGALDADAADGEIHSVLLVTEDMLDPRSNLGPLRVRLGGALRHRLAFRLPSMDLTGFADIGEKIFIRL